MKSKLLSLIRFVTATIFIYLALDLLYRRWVLELVPAQVPGWLVYGVLVLDAVVISFLLAPVVRGVRTRLGKN